MTDRYIDFDVFVIESCEVQGGSADVVAEAMVKALRAPTRLLKYQYIDGRGAEVETEVVES